MNKLTASLLFILLSYASPAQTTQKWLNIKPTKENTINNKNKENIEFVVDEKNITSLTNNKDEGEEYWNLYTDSNISQEVNFKMLVSKRVFESVLLTKYYNLGLFTNISYYSSSKSNYSNAFIKDSTNFFQIRGIDDKFDITIKLLYEDSKKEVDNHTIIYGGNIKKIMSIKDINVSSLTIITYQEEYDDNKPYLKVKIKAFGNLSFPYNLFAPEKLLEKQSIKTIQNDLYKYGNFLYSDSAETALYSVIKKNFFSNDDYKNQYLDEDDYKKNTIAKEDLDNLFINIKVDKFYKNLKPVKK